MPKITDFERTRLTGMLLAAHYHMCRLDELYHSIIELVPTNGVGGGQRLFA